MVSRISALSRGAGRNPAARLEHDPEKLLSSPDPMGMGRFFAGMPSGMTPGIRLKLIRLKLKSLSATPIKHDRIAL